MAVNGKTFIRRFEEYCPLWLAEEGCLLYTSDAADD